MIGTKDYYKDYFKAHLMYKEPILIYYEDGHRFPREYPPQKFKPLIEFLEKKKYEKVSLIGKL